VPIPVPVPVPVIPAPATPPPPPPAAPVPPPPAPGGAAPQQTDWSPVRVELGRNGAPPPAALVPPLGSLTALPAHEMATARASLRSDH